MTNLGQNQISWYFLAWKLRKVKRRILRSIYGYNSGEYHRYIFVHCFSYSSISRIRHDSYYVLMESYRDWLSASTQCLTLGMTLAVVKDVDDVNLLHGMLTEYITNTRRPAVAAWLDGTDMMTSSNGTWYCTALSAECLSIPWASGEPNSTAEHCVCLSSSNARGVHDCACTDSQPFVCEFNLHLVINRQLMVVDPRFYPFEV